MKLLLDTHIFIWWQSNPERLSQRSSELCKAPENTLLLSVASVWEAQIKQQIGKLRFKTPLAEIIQAQRDTNGLEILPIRLEHVLFLSSLPMHHGDPFNRILIAQARVEGITLVTADSIFARYDMPVLG